MSRPVTLCTGRNGEIGRVLGVEFERQGRPLVALERYLHDPDVYDQPERLLHLAGRADESDPAALIEANVEYLRGTIAAAQRSGITEIIFFSSAAVYGQQDKEDVTETDPLNAPGLYGTSKLLGERLLEIADIQSLCLRLPGVLELRKATNFVSRIFEQLYANDAVEISNGDRLFNNFVGVGALARFLCRVDLKKPHDTINLASNKQLTLVELISLIRSKLNSTSTIQTLDDDRSFFNLSIDKAVAEYGYTPGDTTDMIDQWCTARLSEKERQHV